MFKTENNSLKITSVSFSASGASAPKPPTDNGISKISLDTSMKQLGSGQISLFGMDMQD